MVDVVVHLVVLEDVGLAVEQHRLARVGREVVEVLGERVDLRNGEEVQVVLEGRAWDEETVLLLEVAEPVLQDVVVVVEQLDGEELVVEDVPLGMAGLEETGLDLDEEVAITRGGLKPRLVGVEPDVRWETRQHVPHQGTGCEHLGGVVGAGSVLHTEGPLILLSFSAVSLDMKSAATAALLACAAWVPFARLN